MRFLGDPRGRGVWWPSTGVLMGLMLAGCQGYRPAPVDLGAHRLAVSGRLERAEALSEFAARLAEQSADSVGRFDLTDGLSLGEAEVLALFYNPDLRLARLDAGISAATAEHAGLWTDPELGFDGEEILSPAGPFQWGLMAGLTIPISGRLEVERELAGAEHEAVLRGIVDEEWSVRFAVRRAWARWTVARERLGLLDEAVGRVERIRELSSQLEAAGELGRVEARLFRVELLDRQVARDEAGLGVRLARLELLRLLGLAHDAASELQPVLPTPAGRSAEDPVARLIRSNTSLAVRRAEYRAAEQSLRLAVREQFPDVSIGSGYGTEGHDDRLLLGLSIPIPVLNGNRAEIARARAEREVSRGAVEVTFERLAARLAAAQATREAVGVQLERFRSEVLPLLEAQSDEIERLAELGEVDTLLLLETVDRDLGAKSALLDLRLAEIEAGLAIEELLGPDEPGSPAPWQMDETDPTEQPAPGGVGGSR